MSTRDKKESSLLGPVIGAYDPTDADAERIFARIEAALDAEPAAQPAAASSRPNVGMVLVTGASCVVLALVTGLALRSGPEPTDARPQSSLTAFPHREPAGSPNEHEVEPVNAQLPSDSSSSIPLVAVDSLPNTAEERTSSNAATKRGTSVSPSMRKTALDADTLEKEARLLADARRASHAGAGERALELLDEHASTFPNGALVGERDAERILVLCRLGRRAEATRAAAAFLASQPKGPLTRRVEMSCAGTPDTKATE